MIHFVAGNKIALLHNGQEYFPALEAALDRARQTIYLETYIFEQDATGRRIAEALIRGARRGVRVHLLIDGFGSRALDKRLMSDMMEAGVRLLVYRPERAPWRLRRHRLRRLHRKVAVADRQIAFVGGINVIDDLDTPGQRPPRFDYAVAVEGPLVAAIFASSKHLWSLVAWTYLHRGWLRERPVALPHGSAGTMRAAFVVRDNLRHRRDIEQAYLAAIASARSEVILANAYFLPGLNFRRALVDAAARGVKVTLLLQGRVEYFLLHYASRALYGNFLDAGIEIQEYRKSFLHAKVAVVDGHWATVGSSNIDPFSLLLSREGNVVIEDERFAQELKQSLLAAMADGAAPILPDSWARQPLRLRIATWLSYGIVRFLMGMAGYAHEDHKPKAGPFRKVAL